MSVCRQLENTMAWTHNKNKAWKVADKIETWNSDAVRQKFPGRKDNGGEEFEESEDGSGDKNMSNQPAYNWEL